MSQLGEVFGPRKIQQVTELMDLPWKYKRLKEIGSVGHAGTHPRHSNTLL